MMTLRHLRCTALLTVALVGACSSDSPVGPSERQPADLSQVLSEMKLPAAASVAPAEFTGPVSMILATPTPASCSYDGTSSFVCPSVTVGRLTISQSFTLLDGSGNAQSQFDPASTAAVRTTTTVIGTISDAASTLHLDHKQVLTLSGLLTGTHVLDGTQLTKMDGTISVRGVAEPTSGTVSSTIASVVLPKSSTGNDRWPLSGSITTIVGTQQGGIPDLSATIKIVFNGTSRVPMTISVGGFPQTLCVDLSGQTPPGSCS